MHPDRNERRLAMLERDRDKLAALVSRWPCPAAARDLAAANWCLKTARSQVCGSGCIEWHLNLAASRLTQGWRAIRYTDTRRSA